MRKIKITVLGFAILSMATLNSCKKEEKKTTKESCTNSGNLKYLKVGNKWVYNYAELSLSEDTLATLEITSFTSGDAYKIDITGGGTFFGANRNRYVKECNDWFLVNPSGDPGFANDKSYPLIRKAGDKWTIAGSNNYEVLATGVSVKTEAGTFICDKITYAQSGAFNVDTIYYSNEVGWIKYVGFLFEYDLKSKNF